MLEPQAQFVFQSIHFDGGDSGAGQVEFDDVDSLTGRLGVRLARTVVLESDAGGERRLSGWLRTSLVNEFLADPKTTFASDDGPVSFGSDRKGAAAQIQLGFDVKLEHKVAPYGNIGGDISLEGAGHALSGKLGLKMAF